ncbi:MAG: alanine dehydrogenase [Chlamydiales bacterium]|nr:alanine dehydrogenase [Chlamydiales bacterium]
MLIGIPKEVKNHEYRVGATPSVVKSFVEAGHRVLVETKAGDKVGFSDEMYEMGGAKIVGSLTDVYKAELIMKVKEPQKQEFSLMHEGQILYCFLHLAPDPEQTKQLLEKKVIGIAYETVTDAAGRLPLLTPMSEIAGRISIQAGATALQMANGGRGVLLGGIPGVRPGKVLILGGGVVGTNAAMMAMGLNADVTILDRSLPRLRELDMIFSGRLKTIYSTQQILEEELQKADLVIGAVLVAGKTAPKLIKKEHLKLMKKGSVIVDVSIDQGGCSETSRPTTHSDPIYVVDDIVHYCVTNMPGAVARSSTIGLTNATLGFALQIANKGYKKALLDDSHLLAGLNVYRGKVTNEHVAHDLGYQYVPPGEALK